MKRINFIKSMGLGIASLTLLSVINMPSESDEDKLERLVSEGKEINNQSFIINRPITFDVSKVKIKNCNFIINRNDKWLTLEGTPTKYNYINSCCFKLKHNYYDIRRLQWYLFQ